MESWKFLQRKLEAERNRRRASDLQEPPPAEALTSRAWRFVRQGNGSGTAEPGQGDRLQGKAGRNRCARDRLRLAPRFGKGRPQAVNHEARSERAQRTLRRRE